MKILPFFGLALALATVLFALSCSTKNNKNSGQALAIPDQIKPEQTLQSVSLFKAALEGDLSKVSEMVQQGSDVNQTDQDGRTALMYAAFNGHAEVAKILLAHKTDVNLRDPEGRTALMFASSGPFPETVKLLLDHQADPNIVDFQEHFTALMYAAAEGQLENVKILLGSKADPSLKDIDGDNALTFARNNGHLEVARLLEEMND